MAKSRPNIPALAKRLERAVPASVGKFDSAAFLRGEVGSSVLPSRVPEDGGVVESRLAYDPPPAEAEAEEAEEDDGEEHFVATPFPGAPPDDDKPRPFLPGEREHYVNQYIAWKASKEATLAASSGQRTDLEQTSHSESAEVSSGLFNRPPNACIAANAAGGPCGAYKRLGTDYCAAHDPDYVEEMRLNRTKGGRTLRRRSPVYLPPDFRDLDFNLLDSSSMQGTIDATMRMVLLGYIPPAHANSIMRLLNGAIRNLQLIKQEERERRADSVVVPSYEQYLDYAEPIGEFALAAQAIKDRLEVEEARRRSSRIAEATEKTERNLRLRHKWQNHPDNQKRTPKLGFGANDLRPFLGSLPRL